MGLDTVELVLAFEEEFGIEIPDEDAEKMVTVGDVVRFMQKKIAVTPPEECLTQKIFYKLRRALIENYNLQRRQILRKTRMSELISVKEIEEGWPYLQMFLDLETPNFKKSQQLFGHEYDIKILTVEEIIRLLITLNKGKLGCSDPKQEEILERVINITVQQLNVNRSEVHMNASFTRDLGAG